MEGATMSSDDSDERVVAFAQYLSTLRHEADRLFANMETETA